MKEYVLWNSDNGFIVKEVNGRSCSFCKNTFTYKDDNNVYHLVDRASGLSICQSKLLKYLEDAYESRKQAYEEYIKSDAYQIKVQRFEKLKLVDNYSKGVK